MACSVRLIRSFEIGTAWSFRMPGEAIYIFRLSMQGFQLSPSSSTSITKSKTSSLLHIYPTSTIHYNLQVYNCVFTRHGSIMFLVQHVERVSSLAPPLPYITSLISPLGEPHSIWKYRFISDRTQGAKPSTFTNPLSVDRENGISILIPKIYMDSSTASSLLRISVTLSYHWSN